MPDLRTRIPAPRAPQGVGWVVVRMAAVPGSATATAWQNGRVCAISDCVVAEYPDGPGIGPQWNLSISDRGRRPKRSLVRKALTAFGMRGAEEDNHHPGIARHFWLPVDPAHRVECQCKADELVVTEPDGYRWTTPTDGPCRGCELERLLGFPCPRHRPAEARRP